MYRGGPVGAQHQLIDAVPGRAGSVGDRPNRQGHQYAEEHHYQAEEEERALPTAPQPWPAGAVDRDERPGTVTVMVVMPGASAAMVPTRAAAVTAATTVAATVHNQPSDARSVVFVR